MMFDLTWTFAATVWFGLCGLILAVCVVAYALEMRRERRDL